MGVEVLVVPERAVEQAIALLAEGAKVVAEGAGAAGLAAMLTFPERFAGRPVGTVVCGGNIDARILANVLLRNLLRDGRILRLHLDIPDRPGVLADIAMRVGRRRRQCHRGQPPAAVRRALRAERRAGADDRGA